MDIKLASRVRRIKPSPTLAVTAKANQLRLEGVDVINLAAGEPDFDTPEHIKQAAIDAIKAGKTKYTPVGGTNSLKAAVIDKFERDNGLTYSPNEILISNGGKQSFYNLCQAVIEQGDEVIIPAPYWVSYPDMVLLADGIPAFIIADHTQSFKITAKQLTSKISTKTKMLVLNSPSNPTGTCYTASELESLAEVLLKHPQILIATDDMYEHILFNNEKFSNILSVCPELKSRTIVLNGVSKAYSMTGWRIGYAAGCVDIIESMKNIQSQSTSNPCSISQAAAEAALSSDQECVNKMNAAFEERHNFVIEELNKVNGISCTPSQGTFYCFANVDDAIRRISGVENDVDFATHLLTKCGIAVVPGTAFGLPGYMRISFANSKEKLADAMQRLKEVLG
ncbi:MAG: pyridoxal phosphate-dependent aminotransferase [Gammaproteobacteria bacterium]|nr:pyridoxal phosphate-dependent aminotransferase [Gammaproteobacteria bacterium]